jgi:hypothetical protein
MNEECSPVFSIIFAAQCHPHNPEINWAMRPAQFVYRPITYQ